jgi:hypothetical protein
MVMTWAAINFVSMKDENVVMTDLSLVMKMKVFDTI